MDPGCQYCKKLFGNAKKAGFEQKYNFSYVLYPIPDIKTPSGYKFQNSYLIASYIEATKLVPLKKNTSPSPDWQILEKIFTESDTDHTEWQNKFNLLLNAAQAEKTLQQFLEKIGYSPEEIATISKLAHSETVKKNLAEQKNIIENKLRTVKIPTIVFGGRRFDRVIGVEALK